MTSFVRHSGMGTAAPTRLKGRLPLQHLPLQPQVHPWKSPEIKMSSLSFVSPKHYILQKLYIPIQSKHTYSNVDQTLYLSSLYWVYPFLLGSLNRKSKSGSNIAANLKLFFTQRNVAVTWTQPGRFRFLPTDLLCLHFTQGVPEIRNAKFFF